MDRPGKRSCPPPAGTGSAAPANESKAALLLSSRARSAARASRPRSTIPPMLPSAVVARRGHASILETRQSLGHVVNRIAEREFWTWRTEPEAPAAVAYVAQ